MFDVILAAIKLASGVVDLLNKQESSKYIDKLVQIKTDIIKEEDKGYWADDAKIETLYQELKITMEAISNEISLLKPNK